MNLFVSQISYNLIKQKSLAVVLYKKFLDDNDLLAYLTHNEGTSIVAERFIRTIKGKIYIKMTTNDNILVIDTSYFRGKIFIGNDGSQNCFVYQPTLDALELKKDKDTYFVLM